MGKTIEPRRDADIFVPFTVDQYHRMIDEGIVATSAGTELIDGFLVRKDRAKAGGDIMSIGEDHSFSVQQLWLINAAINPMGLHARIQQPVSIPPFNEPEPDGSIVRGLNTAYRGRKPLAEDTLVVIEVADSSLDHDRSTKLALYARAEIPQYLIVNLVNRQIESFRKPDSSTGTYRTSTVIGIDGTVVFFLDDDKTISVSAAELLP